MGPLYTLSSTIPTPDRHSCRFLPSLDGVAGRYTVSGLMVAAWLKDTLEKLPVWPNSQPDGFLQLWATISQTRIWIKQDR